MQLVLWWETDSKEGHQILGNDMCQGENLSQGGRHGVGSMGERDRRHVGGGQGGLSGGGEFPSKTKGNELVLQDTWEKIIPGMRNRKCKDSGMGHAQSIGGSSSSL